jgi:teichuronic acid biosynthesis glycosyltransferase TuaG
VMFLVDCSVEDIYGALGAFLEDPRLHYCKNEKNLGAAGTRNRGVQMARGTYVAFLDADDWWEEGKLAAQMELLKKTKDVLCCTGRSLVSPEGEETGKYIPVKERITYRDLLKHNSINCSSVLLRRDVALLYPMEHEDSHEDYITWLKILKEYGTASGINRPFLKYRLTDQGKSGNKLQSAGMTFKVYRYMGFGMGKSILCFLSYAIHGIWKYR